MSGAGGTGAVAGPEVAAAALSHAGTADPAGASGHSLAEEIRVQQTVSLHRLMPAMIVGNLGVPAIVLATLWQLVPLWFVAIWYGAVVALILPVAANWWRFRGAPPPTRVSPRRIRSVTLWSLAMGGVLALGTLYLLMTTGTEGQLPVYTVR